MHSKVSQPQNVIAYNVSRYNPNGLLPTGFVGHSISRCSWDVSPRFQQHPILFPGFQQRVSSSVAYTAHLFHPRLTNSQTSSDIATTGSSKIHQACHPHARIKTAPLTAYSFACHAEHFDPAIFCTGVFTRNEERTTGYRPVKPSSR